MSEDDDTPVEDKVLSVDSLVNQASSKMTRILDEVESGRTTDETL
jgi:hypothetical protein